MLHNWSWFEDYSGPAGRIWLAWYPLEVNVDILRVENQLIHCRAYNKQAHTKCLITVLYGDYDLIPRRGLWEAIRTLATGISEEPWLVLGDFNAVIDDSEVCGRAADTSVSMAEFRSCIMDTGLVQLPSSGCPFTWHNCSEGTRSLWKRLDRMLVNEAWLDKWPGASYNCALPSTSDHSPLILTGTNREAEHTIFRFDNYLAHQPGFLGSVANIWRHHISGTTMYEIVCKLKALKAVFRRQRNLKGNLTENVNTAKKFLDKAQALFAIYKEDILLQLVKCCRSVYSEAIKQEVSMLQQRAKLRWMKHGDQNSKVFFRKINSARAKQRVFQIMKANGEILTETQDVTHEFISYFQSLLGGTRTRRVVDLDFLRPVLKHTLTTQEANLLDAPVTESDIKEAFFDIDDDSAPGPDGYTSAFFKSAWPVVGQAISEAVGEFFRTGKLLKQINTTLLTLIPKVSLPSYVSDYRPISCCNVLYKAITKIIVRRLQLVLHLLIDYSQNAFVPGRSISDNILLAQELLAGYNQVRLPHRCTLKVDIQKAYDSVEWDFLLEVLRLLNFSPRFIVLIEQCVTTATFSIALNGAAHGFFKGSRGLRQGDPMSPYLFVLTMEIWSTLLRYRVQHSAQFQYHWKCKEIGLLNLCFADDILLFCKAHLPSIQVLKDALSEFAALSGLNVNPEKSQIIISRSVQHDRRLMVEYLGFQEGLLPVKYLGVPLNSSRLTVADCRPLINKIDTRLAGWNQQNLSYAGRVQLIKSVLSTLHTYGLRYLFYQKVSSI
ncbi:UNVERIFIED_CONTAM: LINE-1 reverse transcriptase [Sesamum angustifolium]|uniref:LINE-1 reverse transcriptase n=1 Tax=Sesamum angustifolium TaxID=2727405 RepID=A0AAW2K8M7_9LAMI